MQEDMPMVEREELENVADQIVNTSEVKTQPPQQLNLEDFKVGYVVGIDSHDKVFFRPFGYSNEFHGLLGVHEIASKFMSAVVGDKLMTGDRIVHEVGKAVGGLTEKVDKLTEGLDAIEKEVRKLFFRLGSGK